MSWILWPMSGAHWIRYSKNLAVPTGIPDDLIFIPQVQGDYNYVKQTQVTIMTELTIPLAVIDVQRNDRFRLNGKCHSCARVIKSRPCDSWVRDHVVMHLGM